MLRRAQAAIAGRLPTLATRFGLGDSACWRAEDPTLDRALIARSLGWLFLVGASVSVVWLLLPHAASSDDPLVWAATIGAYAVAAVLFVGYDRLPHAVLKGAVAVAAVATTMALYANHESGSVYQLFYLWATLYAYDAYPVDSKQPVTRSLCAPDDASRGPSRGRRCPFLMETYRHRSGRP